MGGALTHGIADEVEVLCYVTIARTARLELFMRILWLAPSDC